MIKEGKELRVINIGSSPFWKILPITKAETFWQYFKEDNLEYEPLGVVNTFHYGDVNFKYFGKYYLSKNKIPNDTNPSSMRMAAFVIDTTELWEKQLALAVLPISVYRQMRDTPGSVGQFDWEITSTGHGLEKRYSSRQLDAKTPLSDIETTVIKATIEAISMESILVRKKRAYTQIKYTEFDRFDIMDFDDE